MKTENKDLKYRIGFSLISGIGPVRFTYLESYFGGLEKAWQASPADLKHAGLDKGAVHSINNWRPKISLEADMEKLERYGLKVLTWCGPDYPARLKEIYDYPPVLYVRGWSLRAC